MKSCVTLFLATLLPFVLTASAEESTVPRIFTLVAVASTTPIHLQPINADNQLFYIGKGPNTYCPLQPVSQCPPGKETGFTSENLECSLSTEVPGGQAVYVSQTGALGFTQAHSGLIPPGASYIGFFDAKGANFGEFTYYGKGFLACPAKGGKGPYQVFAKVAGMTDAVVPNGKVAQCIKFSAVAPFYDVSGPAAWQYE